jgi:DNA polymerase-3 subunit epsilon
MSRPRSEWEEHLRRSGFEPWSAVTKNVRLVVAADPDSLSGKARKARDYGIPIVGEAWLIDTLG